MISSIKRITYNYILWKLNTTSLSSPSRAIKFIRRNNTDIVITKNKYYAILFGNRVILFFLNKINYSCAASITEFISNLIIN